MSPTPVMPADFELFTDLVDVQLAQDGSGRVAVATSRPDLTTNSYERRIVVVSAHDGAPAHAAFDGSLPRWSPVSSALAGVRRAGERWQIVVVGPDREDEPTEVCTWPVAIEELSWSPDGRWLLFVAREALDPDWWSTPVERRPPLRLTRLRYQEDSVGLTVNRPRQAYLVPASGGVAHRLSLGGFDDAEFGWHPDSQSVVFVSQRHEARDRTLLNDILVQSIVPGAEPVRLTGTQFCFGTPRVSPDGATIAFTAIDVLNFPANVELGTMPAAGGSATLLTEALDRDCSALAWHGNESVTVLVDDAGATHCYDVPVDGAAPRLLLGGERRVGPLVRTDDGLLFGTLSSAEPPRLVIDVGDDDERILFAPNENVATDRIVHTAEHRSVPTATDVSVDSWLVLPDSGTFTAPYPLLVCLQGGGTQYGSQWSHEFQMLNAAGYATLFLNARGSAGYGRGWARTVCGPQATTPGSGWGTVDIDDVAAVVEATLAANPNLDANRVGVQGGSYGALVTTWLLARTELFHAGWAERGPYNVHSLAGTNDEMPWFGDTYLGRSHVDDPAAYWAPSPLRAARSITAPLAIVHSELDRRCPIQQAEELFMALKVCGNEVELIRFPGESHELTRSGSPVHRLQRLEIMLEWFGRWLAPQHV